jgi:hypothetical protein
VFAVKFELPAGDQERLGHEFCLSQNIPSETLVTGEAAIGEGENQTVDIRVCIYSIKRLSCPLESLYDSISVKP